LLMMSIVYFPFFNRSPLPLRSGVPPLKLPCTKV
jgi:hypothetical protein